MFWRNARYDTFGCSWISDTLFWDRIWHGSGNNCIYFRKGLAGDLVLDYVCHSLLLSAAVKEKQDLKRVRFWLLVGILVTIGGFLEAWANPWLLEFLYSLNIF